jgi:hypothetical protein
MIMVPPDSAEHSLGTICLDHVDNRTTSPRMSNPQYTSYITLALLVLLPKS